MEYAGPAAERVPNGNATRSLEIKLQSCKLINCAGLERWCQLSPCRLSSPVALPAVVITDPSCIIEPNIPFLDKKVDRSGVPLQEEFPLELLKASGFCLGYAWLFNRTADIKERLGQLMSDKAVRLVEAKSDAQGGMKFPLLNALKLPLSFLAVACLFLAIVLANGGLEALAKYDVAPRKKGAAAGSPIIGKGDFDKVEALGLLLLELRRADRCSVDIRDANSGGPGGPPGPLGLTIV